jgi:hypothetical protein
MPNLGKFVGKWIVIANNTVVSSGNVGKEVFAKAKQKCPTAKLLLLKLPFRQRNASLERCIH